MWCRVSIRGVKSLGGHFACLCRGFDFYEVKKKKNQKENENTLTLLIIIIVKRFQKEQIAQITQYDPWSARINLRSTQSDLTRVKMSCTNANSTSYNPYMDVPFVKNFWQITCPSFYALIRDITLDVNKSFFAENSWKRCMSKIRKVKGRKTCENWSDYVTVICNCVMTQSCRKRGCWGNFSTPGI